MQPGRAGKQVLADALYNAKKFLAESQQPQQEPEQPEAKPKEKKNSSTINLSAGPGKNEQTLTLDVDLPYGLLNGDHEISIPLRLGKNDKGETFIIGLAESLKGLAIPTGVTQGVPVVEKEEEFASSSSSEIQQPTETQAAPAPAAEALNATWLADVTFPDDACVAPGTGFNKIWRVQNTGSQSWPMGTQLVCVSGFGKTSTLTAVAASYDVAQVAAGEQVLVTARDVVAPETAGKHTSYYRFVTPDG